MHAKRRLNFRSQMGNKLSYADTDGLYIEADASVGGPAEKSPPAPDRDSTDGPAEETADVPGDDRETIPGDIPDPWRLWDLRSGEGSYENPREGKSTMSQRDFRDLTADDIIDMASSVASTVLGPEKLEAYKRDLRDALTKKGIEPIQLLGRDKFLKTMKTTALVVGLFKAIVARVSPESMPDEEGGEFRGCGECSACIARKNSTN